MATPADKIQEHYLIILNLTTSEHTNLYNKAVIGLPGSDRYKLTSSN